MQATLLISWFLNIEFQYSATIAGKLSKQKVKKTLRKIYHERSEITIFNFISAI